MKFHKTELFTDRLRLRKPVIDDAKSLFASYTADPEVTKYLSWIPHMELSITEEYLRSCLENWEKGESYSWIIEKKESGPDNVQIIGMINIAAIEEYCSIGFVLQRPEWNKGYASEALEKMIELTFKETGIKKIKMTCDIENAASARVMEKNNMRYAGILEKHALYPNISDKLRDSHSYEITADEYFTKKKLYKLIPNTELRNRIGPFGDKDVYYASGKYDAEKYIRLGRIQKNDNVLDLGCGSGRMAVHLANFLSEGSFVGADNSQVLLDWCKNKIAPSFQNSSFMFLDIFNGAYFEEGKYNPSEMKLDLIDASIDVVIADSLFTHMFLGDISHYFDEIRRVLKTGGRLIASYYLLNESSLNAMKKQNAFYDFKYQVGTHSKTKDRNIPEEGIAHSEERILEIYHKKGFIDIAVHHGKWTDKNNPRFADVQDVIASIKK